MLAEAGGRRRFACITHSTGGPVVREWLDRYHAQPGTLDACPMSHLVMLAPANFGSALAQLGTRAIVELTALIGYYTMVAMTLNCHEIPLPEGVEPAFPLPQHAIAP